MTLPSDVNEGINQALEVAHGGQDDRNDSFGVLPFSIEVEKESQANAGSTRRSLSPNTEEVCPDHAQTARQNDSRLCVRQLRKDGQIDVADLATGNAPVKDSPLAGSNSGVSTSARVDAPEVSNSLAVFLGGIDALIQQVEGVLLRHRVTETGLAEVGQ